MIYKLVPIQAGVLGDADVPPAPSIHCRCTVNLADSFRASRQGLNHKILPPRPHKHAVQRDVLLARLFGESAPRVVVFQGPAGHGKTSLMLQAQAACDRRDYLTGWLSLDDGDNDVQRLIDHLQAIVAMLGGRESDSRAGEDDTLTPRSDWLIGRLLELGQPVALFVDDLHAVTDKSSLRLLRELIGNAPDRVRWFLASRVVPEVGLPKLVAGEEARIITADALRFSRAEIRRLFDSGQALSLSEAELDAVFSGTEGWPAAVQLYRLALGSDAVRASLRQGRASAPREVADYLAENVLGQQPAAVQSFLLQTCVLARFSASLCDALLDRHDSHEMLAKLERDGLFVRRLAAAEGWFTYHALFSSFLQDQLARSGPAAVRDAHSRAAAWFESRGELEEALHHHLGAHAIERACAVFDRWAEELVPEGHLGTVARWAARLPSDAAQRRPGIAVKLAWAYSFLVRHEPLGPLLPVLQASLSNASTDADPRLALAMVMILQDDPAQALAYAALMEQQSQAASRFERFERSASCNVRAFVAMAEGQFDDALRWLARGRELSEQANATFTLGYSVVHTGLTLLAQGQLQESISQLRAGISDRRMVLEESVSKACMACALIFALHEANETNEALALFEQFHSMIVEACVHDYLVVCFRSVARIHDERGAPDRALAVLEEAEGLAYAGRWPRAVQLIHCERLRRELIVGRVDRAQSIANRLAPDDGASDRDDWVRFSEDIDGPRIARIRLAAHAGQAEDAIAAIESCLAPARAQGRVHRMIRLHMLAAIAYQRLGQIGAAQQALVRAIERAAPGGYVRMFLDEGPVLVRLLKAHAGRLTSDVGDNRDTQCLLGKLLGAPEIASSVGDTPSITAPLLEPLTKREQKVLAMLADYLSNEQIAKAMFVSDNTVKFHLKNIYSKLGVKTRLEAIRFVKTSVH